MTIETVTFRPDGDIEKMLIRATVDHHGRKIRGLTSHLINEALRKDLTAKGYARPSDRKAKR